MTGIVSFQARVLTDFLLTGAHHKRTSLGRARKLCHFRFGACNILVMMKRVIVLVAAFSLPRPALGECCDLRRVEAEPAATSVRVCESSGGSDCTTPLFEGSVSYGEPREICPASPEVRYREVDPATGTYGPAIVARCDPATNVEL